MKYANFHDWWDDYLRNDLSDEEKALCKRACREAFIAGRASKANLTSDELEMAGSISDNVIGLVMAEMDPAQITMYIALELRRFRKAIEDPNH